MPTWGHFACRFTSGDHRSWPTIRDLLTTHQMVTIVHQCTDGTVFRLRCPSQPELAAREIYRALRIPATRRPEGGDCSDKQKS